ncbi:hypothetical protein [Mycolicibacterium mucogenicum]|uniref:hypothetical protein n=1 Tax=Mycolicibacterium mucogenicum TaxID=56689 RepID=UPI000769C8AB|nr:hypothetical protein [Mycolicibacterium mucogenicum]
MAWAQDPAVEAAAAAAGAEAAERLAAGIEAHTNAKMSPFERKLIGVLEDIRDALQSPPLLIEGDPQGGYSLSTIPTGRLFAMPTSVTNVVDLAAGPVTDPDGHFAALLDAPPEVLGEVLDGAADALLENFPAIGDERAARRFAEVALDAALTVAAAIETSVVPPTTTDGAAGGDVPPIPPADTPTSP